MAPYIYMSLKVTQEKPSAKPILKPKVFQKKKKKKTCILVVGDILRRLFTEFSLKI
jgi:hypothetical protein